MQRSRCLRPINEEAKRRRRRARRRTRSPKADPVGHDSKETGAEVGITFQQIQKYELGVNRIVSSRLYEFAKVLDVPVSYFFEEMPSNALSGRGRKGSGAAGKRLEEERDPLIKRETLELVLAYYKIRSDRVRKSIFEMINATGAASHVETLGGRRKR